MRVYEQAQARAHRIGQTKAVMVYRLLSKKTYEMHMFHQASLKVSELLRKSPRVRNLFTFETRALPSV